jgi:acetyl-CoA acetyltransferase
MSKRMENTMTSQQTPDSRQPVIAGLGITDMSKRVYGKTASEFAADAIRLAAADAGIKVSDIGGLLINRGIGGDLGLDLAARLEMQDLRVLSEVQSYGASAGAMVQYAAMAVASGMVDSVACVFGDAPLSPNIGAGSGAYGGAGRVLTGFAGLQAAGGNMTAASGYALAASRHMAKFGTTTEQLGAVAVSSREWATKNPLAQTRSPRCGARSPSKTISPRA